MTDKRTRQGLAAKILLARLNSEGRGPTLLEHSIIKAGIVQGPDALWNLLMWTIARRKAGKDPTWEEFGKVAGLERSMSYRALSRLREVFGDDFGEYADLIEEQAGTQLDAIMRRTGREAKDPSIAVGLIGPLAAPAGLKL